MLAEEIDLVARFRTNLAAVRDRIADACVRGGRAPSAARLVCVTKALTEDATKALVRAGATDLGENRVQRLLAKQAAVASLPEPNHAVRWHLIGHLQRNKVNAWLRAGAFFHALDGERLHDAIKDRAAEPASVLLEVNVAREAQKHGVEPAAVRALVERAAASGAVRITGLMCMAPFDASPERCREVFRELQALRDALAADHPAVRELSMGMSRDFEIACEEGATLVRVGRALLAGIPDAARARPSGAEPGVAFARPSAAGGA